LLSKIFMNLTWFHELAHVVRGHLDILRGETRTSGATLWDSYDISAYPDKALIRALEYDADRWAGFMAADIAYAKPKYFPELGDLKPRWTISLMLYSYAIVCAYRHHRNLAHGHDPSEYPRPLARLAIFLSGMMMYLDGVLSQRAINRVIREALAFADLAAGVFPEINSLYDLTNEKFRNALIDHGARVVEEYAKFDESIWNRGYLSA
jgi:hypothetical protein